MNVILMDNIDYIYKCQKHQAGAYADEGLFISLLMDHSYSIILAMRTPQCPFEFLFKGEPKTNIFLLSI